MSRCVSTSTEVGGGVHGYSRGIHSQHRMENARGCPNMDEISRHVQLGCVEKAASYFCHQYTKPCPTIGQSYISLTFTAKSYVT